MKAFPFARVFAVAGVLSGVILVVNAAKRAGILPSVAATQLVAPFASLFALALVIGIVVATPAMRGRLGAIGALLYGASLAGFVAAEWVINLVFRYVDAELISELRAGPLGIAFTVTSVGVLIGGLVFFIALWRVPKSPKIAIIVTMISSVPVALRTLFPEIVLDVSLAALAVGVGWLSVWLLRTATAKVVTAV